MKKFVAIGHWMESKNTTCVVADANSMKDFRDDLKGNSFVAYTILSEKKLDECKAAEDGWELYKIVKGCTTNYRKVDEVIEYLEQCIDIIEDKLAAI